MQLQLATQPAQIQNRIDPPQQMIGRNHFFKVKLIEKPVLPTNWRTHHGKTPSLKATGSENHDGNINSTEFFNSLSQERT